MGGALLQLVAYGNEDMFLTKDPQITFFKMVYRRHTSFTKEQIPQYFSHPPNFGKSVNCVISKNGDLLGNIFIVVTLPSINISENSVKFAWVKKIGFAMIKSVSITINGYEINKHYGEWLNIWSELTGSINAEHKRGYNNLIGNVDNLTNFSSTKDSYKLFIPLQFWFCMSSGSFLPLVSLQFSDVKINVEFNEDKYCYITNPNYSIPCMDDMVGFVENEYIEQNINGVINAGIFTNYDNINKKLYYYKITNNPLMSYPVSDTFDTSNQTLVNNTLATTQAQKYLIKGKTSNYTTFSQLKKFSSTFSSNIKLQNLNLGDSFLLVDYYYLDDEERNRFLKSKHDYVIEQLDYTPTVEIDGKNRDIQLVTKNLCKLMVWIVQMKYIYNSKDYFNYSDNIINTSTILCNGNERLTLRSSDYFNLIQAYQNTKTTPQEGINFYSYANSLFNTTQPSGAFNTSQIGDVNIKLSLSEKVNIDTPALFRGYSLSINILRIIDGLCSPVFINV